MQSFIPEQARPLVRLVEARRRPTLLELADSWVYNHPAEALGLLVAAAFTISTLY